MSTSRQPPSSAIPIPNTDGSQIWANPQANDDSSGNNSRRMASSINSDKDCRLSLGSVGSNWDLPYVGNDNSYNLLDENDFDNITRDFRRINNISNEKSVLQENMELMGGFIGNEEDDEMTQVWSDCYFPFGHDKDNNVENGSFLTGFATPSTSPQNVRYSETEISRLTHAEKTQPVVSTSCLTPSPLSATASKSSVALAAEEAKSTYSQQNVANEAKKLWSYRYRSCCGFGIEQVPVEAVKKSKVKEHMAKHGAEQLYIAPQHHANVEDEDVEMV